ncbi:MAG TPA: DUF1501 domain-containing protein [Planctomycetaceae bacterium]|jgi:hypothetical protein|nr:DUF1501 domain-containing protein [Planctomycetaceae bacterium]
MLHRRDAMIRLGQLGASALTLPALLQAEQRQLGLRASGGRAKSCILIYLWGGPPQMDMWDPNPEAPSGIRSHFRPISTKTPGIHVSEEMPLFAQHTDKTAIIRTLSHDSNIHEASVYRTLTGHVDNTLRVPRNDRKRSDAPGVGSVASYFLQRQGAPGTVTIPRPIGHEGVTYSGTYAGYLGPRYDPMEIKSAGEMKGPPPLALSLPEGITDQRVLARRGLLESLESVDRRFQADAPAAEIDDFREMAYGMLGSSPLKKALDINAVDDHTRDRYGRNEWGEAILTARRLVESGVRLVTISWMYIQKSGNVANVWDNHGPFEGRSGYQMLQAEYCLPSLDRGFHALMEDLSGSGQLDETLVAMFGEFGRTPKINKNDGRDHWGACQSAVLAGGGIQGGQVYGTSDDHSAYPKSDAVSPEDLLATIYHAMNISPDSILYDQANRPQHAVDGKPLTKLF